MHGSHERPLVLVAMGGHAFIARGERGTHDEHVRNAQRIAGLLMTLVEREYDLVITHGNGPQVGNLLLQNETCSDDVPDLPLDVLVAMTEGSLGYYLQQALLNHLRDRGIRRYVVTAITQVLVDAHDPAFAHPTKPIGPFLTQETAERRRDDLGWKIREDAGRGWRRLVPSPHPQRVIQRDMIRESARTGHIVVACGGGGVPIVKRDDSRYAGVEAVIDKDLTSSVLATDIGASLLIVLTDVSHVSVHYGKPQQRPLGAVTLDEIETLRDEGHFPPGSMGPKIDAVIGFLRAGGSRALITNPENLPAAIEGRAGSHFVGRI